MDLKLYPLSFMGPFGSGLHLASHYSCINQHVDTSRSQGTLCPLTRCAHSNLRTSVHSGFPLGVFPSGPLYKCHSSLRFFSHLTASVRHPRRRFQPASPARLSLFPWPTSCNDDLVNIPSLFFCSFVSQLYQYVLNPGHRFQTFLQLER